jgi:hypothetical protein
MVWQYLKATRTKFCYIAKKVPPWQITRPSFVAKCCTNFVELKVAIELLLTNWANNIDDKLLQINIQ